MQARALIEIAPAVDGGLPDILLQEIYRESRRGMIMLALHGVHWLAVDRILDKVVSELPLDIPGLRYVATDDDEVLCSAACACERIFVSTSGFRDRITALGLGGATLFPVTAAMTTLKACSAADAGPNEPPCVVVAEIAA